MSDKVKTSILLLIVAVIAAAVAFLYVFLSVMAADPADDPMTSGWVRCDLQDPAYDQALCIQKAALYKGTQAPYTEASNQDEALALWHWATERPRPLSACTAAGVGGQLLPEEVKALCPDYPTPTATATWTATPSPTPTVSPTATPSPQPTDQPIHLGSAWWLPLVGNCINGNSEFGGCGR